MEAMPSFSSRYSQTTTPQPSCLNNKTPEPMVAYKESRNVIAGPTPFPGALDQSLPTVSNKGIEKENRMTRIKIVGPKPPTQEDYRPTPEAGFDRSHAISRTKRKDLARFGEDGQNKEGNRQAVTEAQVSTSNSSAKAPVSEFEGKDLMQLVKIPSSAKKKRSNSARSDKPARVKTGWIKNSAMEALTASTRAARHTRRVEERTPLVSLYSEEIEDDFRLITGQQPQQRPIKRPRNVQAQNKVCTSWPGMCKQKSISFLV